MKELRILMIILVFLLTASSWAQEEPTRVEASVGDRVYSLELPVGWQNLELRKEKEFGPVLLRLGAPEGITQGGVYLQRFPKRELTLERYKVAAREYIENTMSGRVLSAEDTVTNGISTWRVVYEGNGPGYVDEPRRFQNTVLFDGESIVVVHCAAPPEAWDELTEAFDSISNSLRASEGDKP